MTDQSRLAKFHTGDLVMYGGFVYILDHNSGKVSCWIDEFGLRGPFQVDESELRKALVDYSKRQRKFGRVLQT